MLKSGDVQGAPRSGFLRSVAFDRARRALAAVLSLSLLGPAAGAGATDRSASATWFEDVTDSAGLAYTGLSWGSAWGDFDRDGWPDLWVGNHMWRSALFRNQGDGTLVDIMDDNTLVAGDLHGAQWADFDNDGDQDLYVVQGGSGAGVGANRLLVNDGGNLTDKSPTYGVEHTPARSRAPLFFDADLDGHLDLMVGTQLPGFRPSALYQQTPTGFVEVMLDAEGAIEKTNLYAQLADLDGDLRPEMVLHTRRYPHRVFVPGTLPMAAVDVGLPATGGLSVAVADTVLADLDGDLLTDVLIVGWHLHSAFFVPVDDLLAIRLLGDDTEHGVRFDNTDAGGADGDLTFEISGGWHASLDPSEVYIGAAGVNPTGLTFTLSPTDPAVAGILPHDPGVDRGIYLGFDPVTTTWQVLCSSPGRCRLDGLISSTTPLGAVEALGFEPVGNPRPPILYAQQPGGGFTEVASAAGLATPMDCTSAVAGDFDNDMDLDLFLVCGGAAANTPDRLFENQGDGTFIEVPEAGGAAGTEFGLADGAALADYDLDGDLDIFVTNGSGPLPLGRGPNRLFRNTGSANHWLEIDLVGVRSNRDGLGASVVVEAGGKAQLRMRDGGMQVQSQSHARLHFGLGSHTTADTVVVRWPSGIVQTQAGVAADQILTLFEPLLHMLSTGSGAGR